MNINTLKRAGINGFISGILVLTGITFVSTNVAYFPLPVVLAGTALILGGVFFGFRATYLTCVFYRDGGNI